MAEQSPEQQLGGKKSVPSRPSRPSAPLPPLPPSVSSEMRGNYGLLRDLDVRFTELRTQMERLCGHAVQDVRRASSGGGVASDALMRKHSDRIASAQRECVSVAEDKLAVAVQTYELLDFYIRQLDAEFRLHEEESCKRRGGGGGEAGYVDDYKSDGQLEAHEGSKGSHNNRNRRCKRRGQKAVVVVDRPNEPMYCYCRRVSYGKMIACCNSKCKLEWFHFDCVGITEKPRGKWSCSECSICPRPRDR